MDTMIYVYVESMMNSPSRREVKPSRRLSQKLRPSLLSLKVTAGTYLRATPDQSEGQYYLRELFGEGLRSNGSCLYESFRFTTIPFKRGTRLSTAVSLR